MNNPTPNVLLLPPRPPAAINTVLFATGSLLLSLGSVATHLSVREFPANALIESIYAFISYFSMFVLAFILGLNGVMNETKRKQFKHVVERYTNVTGDHRYLPYILPVRAKLVTTIFIIAMAAPVVVYLTGFIDGMNT